ncbi:MAG: HEAT repeat domain-containing protein [Planctomycetales bacterium]
MRQSLGAAHWTIDLDPQFARRDHEDGYIIFDRPGVSIWSVVYGGQPFDPDEAVRSYLDTGGRDMDLSFPQRETGLAGRGGLRQERDRWALETVTAGWGRLARIGFFFKDRGRLDEALGIWHSLQYSPPRWVRLCGAAVPPLVRLREVIEQGFIGVEEAVQEIRERGQVDAAAEILLAVLQDGPSHLRRNACHVLMVLGDASPEIRAALFSCLNDDDDVETQAWAADALLRIGEPTAKIVPAMMEGLRHREDSLPDGEQRIQGACAHLSVPARYHAARILADMGKSARPALDELRSHQWDESGGVRVCVAEALMNLNEPVESVLPPLLQGLNDERMAERERARFVPLLLELGVPADDVVPPVTRILLESTDYTAKVEALDVLAKLGTSAKSAETAIENMIQEDDRDEAGIQLDAARTLLRIGGRADVARPILLAALDSLEECEQFDSKAACLKELVCGPALDSPSLERIARELDHDHRSIRIAAAAVLARNGCHLDRCIATLVGMLGHDDPRTRWEAIVGLGIAGTNAASAADALSRAIETEPIPRLQELEAQALESIRCTK